MGFAEQLMAKEKLQHCRDYPDYVDYHDRRFKYVVGKCVELCPRPEDPGAGRRPQPSLGIAAGAL